MKKIIENGTIIPKGYGIAYYSPITNHAICYPIPINILVALGRKIWIWFMWKHGLHKTEYDHYLWIRSQVEEVYCEVTGGTLSYADYSAKDVLMYFEEYNLDKEITQEDVKDFINNCKTLEELKNELIIYFEIDMEDEEA